MLVPFEKLPDTSRIWIYQSHRKLSDKEVEEIRVEMDNFLKEWTAHGQSLQASYEIKYNRFIVIALDQSHSAASGCSIDASVHFIQALERRYDIDLLDKMNVTFRQGEYITYKPLTDFKKMARDKAISGETVVFNNLVTNVGEYKEHWEVAAKESWHQRFLK